MIVFSFLATTAFIIIIHLGIGLRLTRMNIPFILGTLFTLNRKRACLYGLLLHYLLGWVIAVVYLFIFSALGFVSIWLGLLLGFLHGALFLTAGCANFPALHYRMCDERYGPDASRQLEPPGFLGMNYGHFTPLFVLGAHIAFGGCLALFLLI